MNPSQKSIMTEILNSRKTLHDDWLIMFALF